MYCKYVSRGIELDFFFEENSAAKFALVWVLLQKEYSPETNFIQKCFENSWKQTPPKLETFDKLWIHRTKQIYMAINGCLDNYNKRPHFIGGIGANCS